MDAKQAQVQQFWVRFNKVMMNRQMPAEEKIPKLLDLQGEIDVLPNEQSKWMFTLHSNLTLGDCYVQTHQKYKLTPIVEQCKALLAKMEEWDFSTQSRVVWANLGSRFEDEYLSLAKLCRAKNHQRDVAYCYARCVAMWNKIGDELRCVRVLALQNIALSKIPNQVFFTRERLIEQFPNRASIINQTFDGARELKHDPVEQTENYLAIYDDAERIIQGLIEQQGRLARCPEQYWNIKREVLQLHFGIEWKSPRQLNPRIIF